MIIRSRTPLSKCVCVSKTFRRFSSERSRLLGYRSWCSKRVSNEADEQLILKPDVYAQEATTSQQILRAENEVRIIRAGMVEATEELASLHLNLKPAPLRRLLGLFTPIL